MMIFFVVEFFFDVDELKRDNILYEFDFEDPDFSRYVFTWLDGSSSQESENRTLKRGTKFYS